MMLPSLPSGHRRRSLNLPAALLAACVVAGCSMTPDYLRPDTPIPPAFSVQSVSSVPNIDADWWRAFRSHTLTRLITKANIHNNEIGAAVHRIEQARASFKIARSSIFPFLGATGDVAGSNRQDALGNDRSSTAGAALSYDVDLFGRNRAAADSARADVESRLFDREAVKLFVQAEVANNYIALLLARERLRIAKETIANFTDVLRVAEVRFKAGDITALDVARQKSALAAARALRSSSVEEGRNAQNALAVLIGDAAGTISIRGPGLAALRVPKIAAGQPAALLYRRPDIRRAESDLIAANADIGVARAALFPSLELSLDAAISSYNPASLISAGSLLGPIFQGGRLRAGVRLSEARKAELVETYHRTVLVALQEVENALAAVEGAQQRFADLNIALRESRKAHKMSRMRYEVGSIDYQTLLDAQRTLLANEDSLALARFDRLIGTVALIRALGGGWGEQQSADISSYQPAVATD
jgi:outer membrane protein, multidrug efflux system